MYKDKDRQREANRQAQTKFKAKGITEGITKKGITIEGITQIPKEQMCITDDWQEAIDDKPAKPKRGKDIKCFGDLPMDVQASIDRLSVVEGKIDQTIKANRTAIAVNYQHIFPDRYHSTSMSRTDSTKGAGV